jgi:hypothetical protein
MPAHGFSCAVRSGYEILVASLFVRGASFQGIGSAQRRERGARLLLEDRGACLARGEATHDRG